VLRLIFAFVDIMLHRRGPDSLPSSPFLLWALLPTWLVADFFVLWLAGRSGRWFAVDALTLGLDIWFVWALLRAFNRQPRFRQTMTALLGAGLLLTALQAPLAAFEPPLGSQQTTLTPRGLLLLLTIVWAVDIAGFVFSRALERPYFLCVSIVIGYSFLILSLQATLLQPVAS
jgi:hypothetical protein